MIKMLRVSMAIALPHPSWREDMDALRNLQAKCSLFPRGNQAAGPVWEDDPAEVAGPRRTGQGVTTAPDRPLRTSAAQVHPIYVKSLQIAYRLRPVLPELFLSLPRARCSMWSASNRSCPI